MSRSLGSFIRALAYWAVAAALVAGVPWAMVTFIGSPLPDGHAPTVPNCATGSTNPSSACALGRRPP